MPHPDRLIKTEIAKNPKWSISIYQSGEKYQAICTQNYPDRVLESPQLYNSPEEAIAKVNELLHEGELNFVRITTAPATDKLFKALQSGIFVAAVAATASLVPFQPNQTDWSTISAIVGFASGTVGSLWLNRSPQEKP